MTDTEGRHNLACAIQCLLFASPETLPATRLCEVLEADKDRVEQGVEHLRGMLEGGGLQVVEIAGGYQLATRPEYAAQVHRLLQPAPARLSAQALEVLAIIAYRQPMTRPEVDGIRGVNSQHAVASLVEKGLVTTVGRKDAVGRPLLYGTTPHFLTSFGLKDLKDLPNLEALRHAVVTEHPMVLHGVSQTGEEAEDWEEGQEAEAAPDEAVGDLTEEEALPALEDDSQSPDEP
jgi:segregation and condensation protein B